MYKPKKASINEVYKRYDKDFITLTNRKRASYYVYEMIVDCIQRKKNCIWFYHNDEEFILDMLKAEYAKECEFLFITVMSDINNAKTIYKTESGEEIHVPVRGTLTDEKDMIGSGGYADGMIGGDDRVSPLYQGEDNDRLNSLTSTGIILLLGIIFLPIIFLLYLINHVRDWRKTKSKKSKKSKKQSDSDEIDELLKN